MKRTMQTWEKALASVQKRFISIVGKEAWLREKEELKLVLPQLVLQPRFALESLRQAIMNIAFTGVSISPVHREAWITERDGKAFLDFTYRGLIRIATADGAISSMNASVVYEWDTFEVKQGTNAYLNHSINFNPPKDPEEIARNPKLIWEHVKCAYSIATLANGQQDFIVLPKYKLLKTWNMSVGQDDFINQSFPEEWLRKTALRYHAKSLPFARKLNTSVFIMNDQEPVKKTRKPKVSRLMERIGK